MVATGQPGDDFPTILLVEDDDEVREAMMELLKTHGHRVVVAKDESSATELIAERHLKIGLIVLNQKMGSDDALAVGRQIRSHLDTEEKVPVIVIPSEFTHDMEGTDQSVGGGDFKSYITSPEQLATLIGRLLMPS